MLIAASEANPLFLCSRGQPPLSFQYATNLCQSKLIGKNLEYKQFEIKIVANTAVDDGSHWLKRSDISSCRASSGRLIWAFTVPEPGYLLAPVSSFGTSLSGCTWVNEEGGLWVRLRAWGSLFDSRMCFWDIKSKCIHCSALWCWASSLRFSASELYNLY